MRFGYKTIVVMTGLSVLLLCNRTGFADEGTVQVSYHTGDTTLDTLKVGTEYFTDKEGFKIQALPDELNGLTFTRRPCAHKSWVTIDAPAGSTIYLILGSNPIADPSRKAAKDAGWEQIGDVEILVSGDSHTAKLQLYKLHSDQAKHLKIPGGEMYGVVVAAQSLALSDDNQSQSASAKGDAVHKDPVPADHPIDGATAKIVNNQTTIKCLEILEQDNGMMLGKASDLTLTLHSSAESLLTTVHFITPIGPEMSTERDDVLRYVQVTYPNWYAQPGELTFEDKYNAHDGGSNGAAVGLLMLSAIQGFDIDENIAVTGELAPNGKIHAIGGVSSKVHGAIDANCTLVALPVENKDQLVDALIYGGPQTFLDIQVLGISNMKNAIATVRSDRDQHLADAITEFSALQESQKHDSRYYLSTEGKGHLEHILQLAPDHLSARLLLDSGQNTLPKTLSAGASLYYTFLDADCMAPVLMSRMNDPTKAAPPSAAIHQGLAQLRKLRPIADPSIRPLIDSFDNFILSWDDLETGHGSVKTCLARQKELQDAMAKLQADQALMQKMLNEGM